MSLLLSLLHKGMLHAWHLLSHTNYLSADQQINRFGLVLFLLLLSLSLKFILDLNFAPLFWKLLVSEFLLGVFAILHCSVSAPPVKIVPPQDVHRLLMLSAGMITCSDLGTFFSVTFCKTLDFILLYYFYYRIIIITCSC
jgi:hypothetical protein